MTNIGSTEKFNSQQYILRKTELAYRLAWASMADMVPSAKDLAKALSFVEKYRKTFGNEHHDSKLEYVCRSMETVFSVRLADWVSYHDGLHGSVFKRLLGLDAAA